MHCSHLRDAQQKHSPDPPLRPLRQLHARKIDQRRRHIDQIRHYIAHALRVPEPQAPVRPTHIRAVKRMIPLLLERDTAHERHKRREEVEHRDHQDRHPDDNAISFGEIQDQEPGADGPVEEGDGDAIDDACDPEEVAVSLDVREDGGVEEMAPKA